MLVREHRWVGGICMHCGALDWHTVVQQHHLRNQTPPATDERQCVQRNDHQDPRALRPEPKRRVYASEAWSEIKARLTEVQADAVRHEG